MSTFQSYSLGPLNRFYQFVRVTVSILRVYLRVREIVTLRWLRNSLPRLYRCLRPSRFRTSFQRFSFFRTANIS
jgi:hypothetical protein